MGVYSEYLDQNLSFEDLAAERKRQLQRVSELRGGRDVLVYAADLNKGNAPISIGYEDLLPIHDQLANLSNAGSLDLILETPGGSGEAAEDIVRRLHDTYEEVAVIVPGWAKSAGTIVAMSGDEILMGATSALGPIDAQLRWQGKSFSADALIEGFDKIKEEVEGTGSLNRAYIPILQGISPGELQSAENALNFAKILVTEWLAKYKFKNWDVHNSNGEPVTEEEKDARAQEIAAELCNHRRWLTHGRSIRIEDLERMRVKIHNYETEPDLNDAITRYYTLLQMTFATNAYKVFETATSQVYRFLAPAVPPPQAPGTPGPPAQQPQAAFLEVQCNNCGQASRVQANLGAAHPLQEGALPFPADSRLTCPHCGTVHDLSDARRQIEAQAKQSVVTEGEQ